MDKIAADTAPDWALKPKPFALAPTWRPANLANVQSGLGSWAGRRHTSPNQPGFTSETGALEPTLERAPLMC
jgi:hypothetical protein